MNIRTLTTRVSVGFLALVTSTQISTALLAPEKAPAPNFDKRAEISPAARQPTFSQQQAVLALRTHVPFVKVDYDRITGAPAWVSSTGFLSRSTEAEIKRAGSLGLAPDEPYRAVKAFLIENRGLFGFGPEALTNAVISRDYITDHNGMHTVVWQEQLDGIPLFEGLLIGHITRRGQLVNSSSHFLPDIESASGLDRASRLAAETAPPISARQALANALTNIGESITAGEATPVTATSTNYVVEQQFIAAPLLEVARASLVWLPITGSQIRLCWQVDFMSRSSAEGFQTLVDANSGEVLVQHKLTCYFTDASYRVFTGDSPSPFTPGWPAPSSAQPSLVDRQLVTLPALNATASPNGWINDGDNQTVGNNVHAALFRANTPSSAPQGNPFRVFDFPLNLAQQPDQYENAAVVNLFYWCNWMHDQLYGLGFTEAAGNFQQVNFGRGGIGGDPLYADAQFGADRGVANNASFYTPQDGSHPTMSIDLWTGPSPNRDGDLDAGIICHEYTHGMSNRRVGQGVLISHLQTQGIGEGWSDFYALSLLSEAGDDVHASYPMAGYVSYLWGPLDENYYFGNRRYPYSTDMGKNPLTFKDIDPTQASLHAGVPLSIQVDWDAYEVHNVGEVWCVMLWEARANLIDRYGFLYGNGLILQLVTDGMALAPANPNFVQARDAILQADAVSNCGYDWALLWSAFAKRGLGWGAVAPDSSTTSGVTESYVIAPMTGNPCY